MLTSLRPDGLWTNCGLLSKRHRDNISSSGFVNGDMIHDVEAFFRTRGLVITHGTITHGGDIAWHAVSMSGGSVVKDSLTHSSGN